MRLLINALFLIFAGAAATANAETLRVESSDPFTFTDVLAADGESPPISLDVALTFPAGDRPGGGFPAVVFVHGAGGPRPHHQVWLSLLNDLGFATAYADHFQPRGKGAAVGSHIRLTGTAMAADALNILSALAAHPQIDPNRIVVMGASKGGGVAFYTAWRPLQTAVAGPLRFAGHVAIYPTCVHFDQPDMTGAPILVLVGALDDWTGAEQCRESVAALDETDGVSASIEVYPGALHGFDSGAAKRTVAHAYSVVGCRFTIAPDGRDFASDRPMATPALKRQALGACATRGVTYGGDNAALTAAKDAVRRFLLLIDGK